LIGQKTGTVAEKGLFNLSAIDTLSKLSLDALFDWSGTDAAPENDREKISSRLSSTVGTN
jgi:hypothetical protein